MKLLISTAIFFPSFSAPTSFYAPRSKYISTPPNSKKRGSFQLSVISYQYILVNQEARKYWIWFSLGRLDMAFASAKLRSARSVPEGKETLRVQSRECFICRVAKRHLTLREVPKIDRFFISLKGEAWDLIFWSSVIIQFSLIKAFLTASWKTSLAAIILRHNLYFIPIIKNYWHFVGWVSFWDPTYIRLVWGCAVA